MTESDGVSDKTGEKEHLRAQIRQLREAVTAIENQSNGVPCIQPEELWALMESQIDDDSPMHPRLRQMLKGHVDVDQVKRGLQRLENDLSDLEIQSQEELYDPFEHELDGEDTNEPWQDGPKEQVPDKEDGQEDNPAILRDQEQRPLSAYMGAVEKDD